MSNLRLKILLFLTILTSKFCLADFELGLNYYNKNDFQNAFKEFLESAKYGDHDAQYNLGVMYYRGEYVPQNAVMAYAWMAIASQAENYKNAGLYLRIYNKLPEEEKQSADLKYKELFTEFSEDAIEKKLTPKYLGEEDKLTKQRPIRSANFKWPSNLYRGKGGFVDVFYSVNKQGVTRDHIIYQSFSESFGKAFVDSIRRSLYEPLKIGDSPAYVTGLKRRLIIFVGSNQVDDTALSKIGVDLKNVAISGDAHKKLSYGFFLEIAPTYSNKSLFSDNPNEWYLQSAKAGNATASYFLGRNILNGNMCSSDAAQGTAWLLRSARSGLADAQYMLAIESFSGARIEKNEEKGLFWLAKAASTAFIPAKLKYAWILSTHYDDSKRNGHHAEELITNIDEDYFDKQSLFQTRAAVAAENRNFKEAVKWQNEAISDAESLHLPTDTLKQQLDSYKSGKPWREEI